MSLCRSLIYPFVARFFAGKNLETTALALFSPGLTKISDCKVRSDPSVTQNLIKNPDLKTIYHFRDDIALTHYPSLGGFS